MTTTTTQYAIVLPTITNTMTCAEIKAAWLPIISDLQDAMIDSLFDLELCELYEYALQMLADDYTTGVDYVAPAMTDELPF